MSYKKIVIIVLLFFFFFIILTPLFVLFTSWDLVKSIFEGSFEDFLVNIKSGDIWGSRHKGQYMIKEFEYTDEELDYMSTADIPENMRNFYKLSYLFKRHLDSMGSYSDMLHSYLVGIMSTEAGGSFYRDGNTAGDIFVDPSDKFGSEYVGSFGIHRTSKLAINAYTDELVGDYPIPLKYSGFVIPGDVEMDSLYVPSSSYIAMNIFINKSKEFERSTREIIDELAVEFGITNKKDLADFAVMYVGQAQYHGAVVGERKGYLTFLTVLYKLTGEDFNKLSLVTDNTSDFSESTIRKLVLGNTSYDKVRGKPSDLGFTGGSISIKVGEDVLNESLWSYVYGKYPGNSLVEASWRQLVELSSSEYTGIRARVLNYHYGLVSFMQGERIKAGLLGYTSDMSTVGAVGGIYDGKSLEEVYLEYESKGMVSSQTRKYYKSLSKYFGMVSNVGVVEGSDLKGGKKVKRLPSRYSVPFYSQQGRGTGVYEKWGSQRYGSVGTFEQNGCHVYSFAYGVSAITGRVVNPPEMAVAMYLYGGLDPTGLLYTGANGNNIKPLMDALGLEGYYLGNASSFNILFEEVDKGLDSGGVVVLRGKNGSNGIAYGDSHFFVLEAKQGSGSDTEYLMYTSSRLSQNTWQKKNFFSGNNLHGWSYYVIKK